MAQTVRTSSSQPRWSANMRAKPKRGAAGIDATAMPIGVSFSVLDSSSIMSDGPRASIALCSDSGPGEDGHFERKSSTPPAPVDARPRCLALKHMCSSGVRSISGSAKALNFTSPTNATSGSSSPPGTPPSNDDVPIPSPTFTYHDGYKCQHSPERTLPALPLRCRAEALDIHVGRRHSIFDCGSYVFSLCFPRSKQYTTSSMVIDDSATFVLMTTFRFPEGGLRKISLCSDVGIDPCKAKTCRFETLSVCIPDEAASSNASFNLEISS
mmetsp:Transcript_14092/g.25486  ORF Transcript_14092/g.25486 Transcript_14092/m.25486 type:complete len:269 (+) Transcript_14092:1372-2178(+)